MIVENTIVFLEPNCWLNPSPKKRPIVIVKEKIINPKPALLSETFTISKRNKLLQCSTAPSLNIIIKAIIARTKRGFMLLKNDKFFVDFSFLSPTTNA